MLATSDPDFSQNPVIAPTGTPQVLRRPLPAEPGSGQGRRHGTSSEEPFDRWFRYPAGFASDYVSLLLAHLGVRQGGLIVDPFAGSGVTGTAARGVGMSFAGLEAHPLIAELASLKLRRPLADPAGLKAAATAVADEASQSPLGTGPASDAVPDLVRRSFAPEVLGRLLVIRSRGSGGARR
jgi:hypothetical protein